MTRLASLVVHSPEECAGLLGGITVAAVIKLLQSGGYSYTSLQPGARPWGRGRQRWGLTDDQLAAVIAGQTRRHPAPAQAGRDVVASPPGAPLGLTSHGWDGVDRLAMGKARRSKDMHAAKK